MCVTVCNLECHVPGWTGQCSPPLASTYQLATDLRRRLHHYIHRIAITLPPHFHRHLLGALPLSITMTLPTSISVVTLKASWLHECFQGASPNSDFKNIVLPHNCPGSTCFAKTRLPSCESRLVAFKTSLLKNFMDGPSLSFDNFTIGELISSWMPMEMCQS